MMHRGLALVLIPLASVLTACASGVRPAAQPPESTGLNGHLLIIGGGLDDDNKPVYERFVALAKQAALPNERHAPLVLIATAASLNESDAAKGKVQSIQAYCPTCRIDVIKRDTPTTETVALIDGSSAVFFTGGDQKRITTRYLNNDQDTPESAAMRRLLARGGVIAGTSAGDAMMSDPMFLTGRSAEALGIRSTRTQKADDDDADEQRPAREIPLGPQIGKGMGFVPWVVTDSHFFERHRFGRLVAALEASGKGLGLGVGEDACAEIDLATGDVIGISAADSLLVDARGIAREGLSRANIRTQIIQQGSRVSLPMKLRTKPSPAPAKPAAIEEISLTEPGPRRQLASWRFFLNAQSLATPSGTAAASHLKLDGYEQTAWSDGSGGAIVEITVPSPAQ